MIATSTQYNAPQTAQIFPFIGQGFGYTFLRGKAPFEKEWQNTPHTEEQALKRHKQQRNIGVHAGAHSNNIIWIDLDCRFPEFLEQFPNLCDTLHSFRSNAPDRGKVAIRVTDTLPTSTNYKPDPSKPPVAELLSTGRQAAVIGRHPSGEFYQTNGLPVMEMSFNEVNRIWFEWTGTPLSQADTPKQPKTTPKLITVDSRKGEQPEANTLIDKIRQHYTAYDVFERFGMVGDVAGSSGGFIRLLSNGGLLVGDPAVPENSWKWICHSTGQSGDIFDAWYYCQHGEKIPRHNKLAFKTTLYEMAEAVGIETEKKLVLFTDPETGQSETLNEWIQQAKIITANHGFSSQNNLRAALGALLIFERGQDITYHISSRHLADLTGMSHPSAQKAIRWLCPDMLDRYQSEREKDAEKAKRLLQKVSVCDSGDDAFRMLKGYDQDHVIDRMKKNPEADLYSTVVLFVADRIDRIEKELDQIERGKARGEMLDLLIKESSSNGVFANTYTLNLNSIAHNTAQNFPQYKTMDPDVLLWKVLRGMDFLSQHMRDDAFIRNFIPDEIKHNLSDQMPDEGWTAQTLANAIVSSDGEQFLSSIGPAGPHIIFELSHASHTVGSLANAVGMHEGSLRRVIKRMSERLGMEPLIEKHKIGRRVFLALVEDWETRLGVARRHMYTDGVLHRRTVRHAMERIERINAFLPLVTDEELREDYNRIKMDAQKLLDAIEGKKPHTDAMDVSNLLADVENKLAFVEVEIKTEGDFYSYLSALDSEDANRLRYLLAGDSLPHIEECKILANRLGLAHVLHLVIDVNEFSDLIRQFRNGDL